MKNNPIGHNHDQITLQKQIIKIEQEILDIKEALLDGDYRKALRFAAKLPQRTVDLNALLNTMSNRPPVARGLSDANETELTQLSALNNEIADINDELVRIKRTTESSILASKDINPDLTYQGSSVIMTCRRTKPTCSMPSIEVFLTFDQENRFNFNPKCWGTAFDNQEHCGLFTDLYQSPFPAVWLDEILRIKGLSFELKFKLQIEFKLKQNGVSSTITYRKK